MKLYQKHAVTPFLYPLQGVNLNMVCTDLISNLLTSINVNNTYTKNRITGWYKNIYPFLVKKIFY